MKRFTVEIYSPVDEKKKTCPYFILPSTQQLIRLTKDAHKFGTMDELFTTVMMEYNTKRECSIPSSYPYQEDIPVAIASDPERRMNVKPHKKGKSLDKNRRKVFEAGLSDFPQ